LTVWHAERVTTRLLTRSTSASTALLDLDARLRTQAGAELAHDPLAVREILQAIQTKSLNPREDIGKQIANSNKPTNEMVSGWYHDLKTLVKDLETELSRLEQELSKQV